MTSSSRQKRPIAEFGAGQSDDDRPFGKRNQVIIRRATAEDGSAVAQLLTQLERSAATSLTQASFQRHFLMQLEDPQTHHLVAEVSGVVVGFCSLHFRQRLNRMKPQAYVPDLIVSADARRLGAGRKLIGRAIDLAKAAGCWSMTLDSGHNRVEAHHLYRSVGFRDVGIHFQLEFQPDVDLATPAPESDSLRGQADAEPAT